MAEKRPQTLANHARLDPPFHFVLLPIMLLSVLIAIRNAISNPTVIGIWNVIFVAALVVGVFLIRIYPLKVQDRVIRLEERLRLSILLPEPLRSRIQELTEDQLVGLRFASDGEVASLVEKTLANKWTRKEIKANIRNWRPDYFRV
jgi:Family of unknown function (DUF6526)